MSRNIHVLHLLVAAALSLLLTACGGGGGSSLFPFRVISEMSLPGAGPPQTEPPSPSYAMGGPLARSRPLVS